MARDRRVLPHNLDAEASVLGGVLLRNDVLLHLESLESADFYDHRHKVIWDAIRNLEASARPIDVVTLENEIEKGGKLEAIGGISFLGELALRVPTAENVVAYTEIVRDHSQARKLILAAGEIVEKGFEDSLEIRDYLDDAEAKIFEVTQRKDKTGPEPVKSLIKKVFSSLDERFKSAGGITGVPDRLRGSRRQDRRSPADRAHHPRGAPRDGQDLVRDVARPERGDRRAAGRCWCSRSR